MSKASEYRATAMTARKPFGTKSDSLTGVEGTVWSTGRMHEDEAAEYKRHPASGEEIIYTVLSYGTPIAWMRADGSKFITTSKYSATTSHHLSEVRRAF